ncbi:GAF domain-containing protein [Agrococcus sp. BE272]|uniref:helix-turn-helix domain-containing protein n=1 Tax=Agrococcus sp. BE272 TaxID=2817727 RepID=UPI002864EADF|nr:GAF domain-containing protein [Agrococcus sp. BE272]MDR7233877.1 GAF domain-containing protein [Agrococcus sp. BE272]
MDVEPRTGEAERVRLRLEAQLATIASTTRDLLEVQDATAMLQRIVDRVHELLGAEVTYLSVYDPAIDELFVRAVRGSRSGRFLGMRVPAGVGVASLVVRTRSAQSVADYEELGALPRDEQIDEIVRAEGIHAILGAPLLGGGDVLGVLFAANRAAREFDDEDAALLTAFADHAAIVLRIAGVLEALTASRQEAEAARERAERLAAETLSASRLHGELTELIVRGRGPEDVLAALAAALDRPVWAEDVQGAPLWGSDALVAATARPALARAAVESAATGRSSAVDGGPVRAVIAVVAAGERIGAVLVGGAGPLSDLQRRTLERSAQILALVTMQRNAVADAEERVRGELVLDLLESPDTDAAVRRARQRGIPVDEAWCAVAVRVADADRSRAAARLRQSRGALVALAPEGCAVLLPEPDATEAARGVRALLGPIAAIVVTEGVASLADAGRGMRAAGRAARLLRGLGVDDAATTAIAFEPYAAVFDDDGARARAFVDGALGAVLAWDARRGTELVATLAALLESQGSAAAAARRLGVHLSTVKQRSARLRALLGDDWDASERRFRVEVAARLHMALQGLDRTRPTD